MNADGTAANLVASHPGNQNAVKSGVYSRRAPELTDRAREIADAIMAAPHVVPLDRIGAERIGMRIDIIERIDADLAKHGIRGHGGHPRRMLEMSARHEIVLMRQLREYGLTPASRADLLARLAEGGLAAEIARRRTTPPGDER
jgi:hypothetical protein